MRFRIGTLAAAALVVLSGCGSSPQEQVIHQACQALKADDWDAYSQLTVTEADFLIRENRIAENEVDQSFAGGHLRPQQRQLLKEQFNRAVRGDELCLDFSRCQFVFPNLNGTSVFATLSGKKIQLEEYILTIEMDGPEKSAPGLGPYFILAPWEGGYRILALRFPRKS